MSEQTTTPGVRDVAVLGEHFVAVATARAAVLGPAITERVASWEPQLEQRGISGREWEQWAPLVRAAVLCANPSNTDVAGSLAGDALSLTKFAASRKMPMKMENIFRQGTAAAFLTAVTPSSRATVTSRVNALVAGVTAAAAQPTPTPETPAEQDTDVQGPVLEPLLLDRGLPTPSDLITAGLTSPAAAEVLHALGLVRARVRAIEPTALRSEPRFRGRGRAVPYGDVEVVALLAAASSSRSSKGRRTLPAAICLGVGAGVAGEAAANLKGRDVFSHHDDIDGPAVAVAGRVVPLHIAFAGAVLTAAEVAGAEGFVLGGRGGRNRFAELAASLAKLDPHLVRMNTGRLTATWLAMHATRGVPLGDLLAAGGWNSAAPLDHVLPYLPRQTPTGLALLTGTTTRAGDNTHEVAADAPATLEASA